jgi:hypothetical protein
MHRSLHPKTNARLLAIRAAGAIVTFAVFPSAATAPILVGRPPGPIVGTLQSSALRNNSPAFARANTALEVRAALTATTAGKLAIVLQWCTAIAIAAIAFVRSRNVFVAGFAEGYLRFMLARESVTWFSLRHLEGRPTSPDEPGRTSA